MAILDKYLVLKRPLRRLVTPTVVELVIGLRFELELLRGRSPLLVYQMGKVGSRSVHEAIARSSVPYQVYHVHHLTRAQATGAEQKYKGQGIPAPLHLSISRTISTKRKWSDNSRWKIITLVREPIRTFLSHVFYNPKVHRPFLLDTTGNIIPSEAEAYIERSLATFDSKHDYIASWFDAEFLSVTGIDVYAHEFDPATGYSIIQGEKDDVLVLRLENSERAFPQAISDFLSLKHPIQVQKYNVNDSSSDADLYRDVRGRISIPRELSERVYATKYAEHFYSESERQALIEYWADPSLRS